MIPVDISFGDICIRNIEPEELHDVLKCVNETQEGLKALGRNEEFCFEDIKQRYLESLINSMEYFCGIYKENIMIGIIKGRIESKETRELFIQSLILMEKFREKGIGSRALAEFERHFYKKYSIDKYCAIVLDNDTCSSGFWNKNQYQLIRITQANEGSSWPGIKIYEKRETN